MRQWHWHVRRHSEDDDAFTAREFVDVFGYTATELGRIAEFEHEAITACGEAGDFEEAYRAFVRSEKYSGLAADASNIEKQGTSAQEDRAPLYRTEPLRGPLWERAALHCAGEINDSVPQFEIWKCDSGSCTSA